MHKVSFFDKDSLFVVIQGREEMCTSVEQLSCQPVCSANCYCYFLKIAKNHELSNCASFLQRNMELIKELILKQTINTIKILLDLELEYFK